MSALGILRGFVFLLMSVTCAAVLSSAAALAEGREPVATTVEDYFQPGTQPETLLEGILESSVCAGCHGFYDAEQAPHSTWVGSMMAQSTRDPVFHAALAIANQDAAESGEYCLRCHTPTGWLGGRSLPADGSGLDIFEGDFDGITCHVCHRMVDPVYEDGVSPPVDEAIIAGLSDPPPGSPHSGQYVIDPEDRRRGPFDLGPNFFWHRWEESAFHNESELCATCHDVSNPVLSLQADGSYQLNALDTRHPTHRKEDEFPIERTYSEWANSVFARAPIELGGRFGGNKTAVSSCQDCHMADLSGVACAPGLGGEERDDLPSHGFAGANSWVLEGVRSLYPDGETGLTDEIVAAANARTRAMLESAAELEVFRRDGDLVVRVTNFSGHKLPTGYGEGRRMWVNVRFLDAVGDLVDERGAYDAVSADLVTDDTVVYEIEHALDAQMAAATGLPEGPSFHFVLNNTVHKDNRIPPRGFTNRAFERAQADIVGATYADQVYWDDRRFEIPPGTARVEVRLFHQTTSKEYIEFLRDENTTNDAGTIAYDVWAQLGKSAPLEMDLTELAIGESSCPSPIEYGLGNESASGARARIGWMGEPSVTGGGFAITVDGAEPGRTARVVVGRAPTTQRMARGTLLVESPKELTQAEIDADGRAVIPLPIAGRDQLVGAERYFQILLTESATREAIDLSSALHVDICS